MFKFAVLLTLASIVLAQKSGTLLPAEWMRMPSEATILRSDLGVDHVARLNQWTTTLEDRRFLPTVVTEKRLITNIETTPWNAPLEIKRPSISHELAAAVLPHEVSAVVPTAPMTVGSEVMEVAAPAIAAETPLIQLPKGNKEVVDVAHNNIRLPGDKLENKDILLNLPSPKIEAPHPVVVKKDVLIRFPQDIFEVPKPSIQLKPILHKVPFTVRTVTPKAALKEFLFKVPSAKIASKSAYVSGVF